MTAYASAEASTPTGTLVCELRSVNHRYLEVGVRLPEELRALEPDMRKAVAGVLARGKVELSVRQGGAGDGQLHVDEAVLDALAGLASRLKGRFPGLGVDLVELLHFPGVLQAAQADIQGQAAAALELLGRALAELHATRAREGAKLAGVLAEKLDAVERLLAGVRACVPQICAALRTRLEARLVDLRQEADPARLEQELLLQVTRADVQEELDRLDAHVGEMRRVLALDEPVGRRLDFLMQEFNREANTLGSKSVDTRSTKAAIELKVLIEQMREQVQNIE
jgi:uncharacterized protein (TIGR00255 family)